MAELTGAPSGYGTTEWTNPTYAYADDANKASVAIAAKNTEKNGIWTTFGITDPGGYTITKVEIGTQHYLSTITSIIATMGREISWDGGSTWSATDHALPEVDTEVTVETATLWVDVTADTAWTWTKLNDTNLQVRIACKQGNDATGFTMYLDVIFVRVTYTAVTTYSITKTMNARIEKTMELTKALDARVKKLGITITKPLDARVEKTFSISKTLDATVQTGPVTYEITKALNARVFKQMQLNKTLDARVERTYDITKPLAARVKKGMSLSKTLDARVVKPTTITKILNARVKSTLAITKTLNARVAGDMPGKFDTGGSWWRR